MISLPQLLTTARRFVDGVCAIPRFASMERLEEIHEAHRKATQIRSELGIDETGLIQQLAAERKRHAEYFVETENQLTVLRGLVATVTEQRNAHWLDLSAEREAHAAEVRALESESEEFHAQLSAARADLDALTVWNLQSEKPCPVFEPSEYVVAKESDLDAPGHVLDKFAREYMYWRHTPGSLAAWKAQEGGGNG